MKNYNKILEAIQQGIQLALDDFDDDQVQNIKSKQVQNRDYTKEYLDLMKEVVDLDLPSKTLWCKYNLGVEQNYLLIPEDWYGDYYAWGEIKTKSEFSWPNYKFGKLNNKLTKYCNNPNYGLNGFTDNLIELLPEDDAAYQNKKLHNFKFHIPTKEQCEELINYTISYWVNNYDPNKIKHNPKDDGGIKGLNGRVFEGKNGNQLFIPAAGYYDGDKCCYAGYYCDLQSASFYTSVPNNAYDLYFNLFNIKTSINGRCYGFTVRPIVNL